jgi:hypothetical protein
MCVKFCSKIVFLAVFFLGCAHKCVYACGEQKLVKPFQLKIPFQGAQPSAALYGLGFVPIFVFFGGTMPRAECSFQFKSGYHH